MTIRTISHTCIIMCLLLSSRTEAQSQYGTYPIDNISLDNIILSSGFWNKRNSVNRQLTIRNAADSCNTSGRISNFRKAAGQTGYFVGKHTYDDTDVYKVIEAIANTIQLSPNAQLKSRMEQFVNYVAEAQEDDGYLFTARTAAAPDAPHPWIGDSRWVNEPFSSYELYDCAYLYRAAIAHYHATNSTKLLDVAKKNADLLVKVFMDGKLKIESGHQAVETALTDLYTVTGEKNYLALSQYLMSLRGTNTSRQNEYNQTHTTAVKQDKAVGNATRAMNMYCAMTDIAATQQDTEYLNAVRSIWDDMTGTKFHITGGVGTDSPDDVFGEEYELPTEYATCTARAAIASIEWNNRMFRLSGESKYIDAAERTLYNVLLASVSTNGISVSPVNPLYSKGDITRVSDFSCADQHTDVCQFIPRVQSMTYGHTKDSVYVNLFTNSTAQIYLSDKTFVTMTQTTNYPWDGEININVDSLNGVSKLNLLIRIPGWARNTPVDGSLYYYSDDNAGDVTLFVNGKQTSISIKNGYAVLSRTWKKNDKVTLHLPMNVRRVKASDKVTSLNGLVALECGPVVYCLEGYDNDGVVDNCVVKDGAMINREWTSDFNGTYKLSIDGVRTSYDTHGSITETDDKLTAIPYFAWNNRGANERMSVWLPYEASASSPTCDDIPTDTLDYETSILIQTDENGSSTCEYIVLDKTTIAARLGITAKQVTSLYGKTLNCYALNPDGSVESGNSASSTHWFNNKGFVTNTQRGDACVYSELEISKTRLKVGQNPGHCVNGKRYLMEQLLCYYPADNKKNAHRLVLRTHLNVLDDLTPVKSDTLSIHVYAEENHDDGEKYLPSQPVYLDRAKIKSSLGFDYTQMATAFEEGKVRLQAVEPDGSLNNEQTSRTPGQWFNADGFVVNSGNDDATIFCDLNTYSCILNIGQKPWTCNVGDTYRFRQAITTTDTNESTHKRLVLDVTLDIADDVETPAVLTEDGSFCIENIRVNTFVHDFEYALEDTSVVEYYNVGPVTPRDKPAALPEGWEALNGAEQLRNLLPDMTYSYKCVKDGKTVSKGTFKTSGQVRMIDTDYVPNLRDMGGWATTSGKHIVYGLLYRGSAIKSITSNVPYSQEDCDMLHELGIKAELDLRNLNETNGLTKSMIGDDVDYALIPNPEHYHDGAVYHPEYYYDDFEYIIGHLRKGHPVYFHCIIGCDRTGTLACLLEGLLGVSLSDICKDYELSTFSDNNSARTKDKIADLLDYILSLDGNTVQDKFITYWSTVAKVPMTDINEFMSYMLGEKTISSIHNHSTRTDDTDITFDMSGRRVVISDNTKKGMLYIRNGKKIIR